MKRLFIITAIAGTMLWPFILFAQGMEKAQQQDTDGAFLLDTTVTYYQVPAGEGGPDIAFDGENYMGVWSRNGNIIVGRVTKQGVLIDTNGIVIEESGECFTSSIAYGDSVFLVAWVDPLGYNSNQIFARRITKSITGISVDSIFIHVSPSGYNQGAPDIAFDGTNFFVIWLEANSIKGVRITPSGEVLDMTAISIIIDYENLRSPTIAFDGNNYIVVWNRNAYYQQDRAIKGCRVSPSGTLLPPYEFVVSTHSDGLGEVSVAYGNGKYLVAWDIFVNYDEYFNAYCSRVDTSGQVLDTTGIVVSNKSKNEIDPGIDFDGTNFVVCWLDARSGHYELYGARIDTAGHNLDTAGVWLGDNLPNYGSPTAIVKGDTTCLLIWPDRRNTSSDIYGEIINPNLSFQNSFPVAQYIDTLPNYEYAPAVAYDGDNYLTTFISYQNTSFIYAISIDSSGNTVNKITVDSSDNPNIYSTQVSYGDSNYLITWLNGLDNISYVRATKNCIIADTINNIYSSSYFYTNYALCWGDTTWLAAWAQYLLYPGSPDQVMCRGIGASGTLLGVNTEVAQVSSSLAIAYDGAKFFLVYKHNVITGKFVYENGTVSSDSVLFPATGPDNQLSIAFDGTNYMVVWHDSLAGGDFNIYAAKVNPAGGLVDTSAITICAAVGAQRNPIIVYNGSYCTVLWEDYRNGIQWDIYGARVGTTGQIINQFTACTMAGDKLELAATHGTGDKLLLVFTAHADSVNGKYVDTLRVWGKFIDGTTGINAEYPEKNPQRIELYPSYPNPFRLSTSIRYLLPHKNHVSLCIYNIAGQRIKLLYNGIRAAGEYTAQWNGCDEQNNKVATGIYFYALRTDEFRITKKMVLLR